MVIGGKQAAQVRSATSTEKIALAAACGHWDVRLAPIYKDPYHCVCVVSYSLPCMFLFGFVAMGNKSNGRVSGMV